MLSSAQLDQARHTLTPFSSGETDLDNWLVSSALTSDARGITRTFVWTEIDTTRVVGYYSLMAHVLQRSNLPRAIGSGSPRDIPAILLARLALDRSQQGQGLGGALLADALERCVLATTNVGARFVVVDAINDSACCFYQHYGFKQIPGSLRLVQKISSIAASIAGS